MSRLVLVFLLSMSACSYDAGGVPGAPLDAAPPDAVLCADAAAPPDAAPLCHHVTRGIILGDTIAHGIYDHGRDLLEVYGDTVIKSDGGDTVDDQLREWMTSREHGVDDLDWIYLQAGVFDVRDGHLTSGAIVGLMAVFLEDIHVHNPGAIVFLGAMNPARSSLDTLPGIARYPLWLDVQNGYASLGARDAISQALNNGHDDLTAPCDSGDHLHPTSECDRLSAAILRSWVVSTFPDIPCAP